GLTVSRAGETDAVDETIRRDAFQRSAAELARATGGTVTGRVGDHGVVFLTGAPGSNARKRQRASDFAERVAALGRQRFALSLHFGMAVAAETAALSASYERALSAAETALVQGKKLIVAGAGGEAPSTSLRHLRQELVATVEEHPELLCARFDRYLEAVAVQCGYRVEPAKAHVDVGFERLTEGLVKSGALDEKSLRALGAGLDRAAIRAQTISDLFAAYRRAALDVVEAVQRPTSARQDRSLRRTLDFLRQHYSEPLTRNQVARVAGFAPGYFSELFKAREGITFERYLRGLRLERAKQLLLDSELDAARVGELCGFKTPQYFSFVFRDAIGVTPLAFRKKSRKAPPKSRAVGRRKPTRN
ncbi:MAG TPA: AraC family transcriptional regulator, partial [Polyangiaceae bacterium]|nr:AraC family transcriptional regulator [Polyangiaceae bacterium]